MSIVSKGIRLVWVAVISGMVSVSSAFAEVIEYECEFDKFSDPEHGLSNTEFGFEIVWDSITQDAFIKGNMGVSPLRAYGGPEAITFLEALPSGGVHVTTIAIDGRAAHSRNTLINATFLDFAPSQYYGTCQWSM